MVADKLLQYRIVEPSDIVRFVFHPAEAALPKQKDIDGSRDWSNQLWWELLHLTIEKINGRVTQLQNRLETLTSQELQTQERAEAEGVGAAEKTPEQDGDAPPPLIFPTSAVEISTKEPEPDTKKDTIDDRRRALDAVQSEQRTVLTKIWQGFNEALPSDMTDGEEDWQAFWVLGWTKEFLRRVSYLARPVCARFRIALTNSSASPVPRSDLEKSRDHTCIHAASVWPQQRASRSLLSVAHRLKIE